MKNGLLTIIIVTLLAFILLSWLTGCSTIHKIFHKQVSKVDSTSIVHEKKDSTVNNNIIAVHSDSSKNENEIVIDFGDKKIVVPYKDSLKDNGIYYYPVNPNDYFNIDERGIIHTNAIPKSVTIKGKQAQFNYDSLSDHSKITLDETKDQKTQVKSIDKQVDKEKKKTAFEWWWFLLIIPAYFIIKHWKGIKAFFIHLIVGL